MNKLDEYKIDLKAIQSDVETRSVVADDSFFVAVEGDEIQRGNVNVRLQVREAAGAFTVSLDFNGEVEVCCDRCLEPMMLPVHGESEIRVKLGETYEDDGELIVVPEDDGIIDLSWQVYEQIALQIPIRHVHADGECATEIQQFIVEQRDEHDETIDGQHDVDAPTDPRWDALKKLISTNN